MSSVHHRHLYQRCPILLALAFGALVVQPTVLLGSHTHRSSRHVSIGDPSALRSLQLRVVQNTATAQDVVAIELLRTAAWVRNLDIETGDRIRINLSDLGLSGFAIVGDIAPCPPVRRGPGRVVTATVKSQANDGKRLHLADGSYLNATADHPIYSHDRDRWIATKHLAPGDRLRTATGSVTLQRITPATTVQQVFNIEVSLEHEYFVGHAEVRTHNVCYYDPRRGPLYRGVLAFENPKILRMTAQISPGRVIAHGAPSLTGSTKWTTFMRKFPVWEGFLHKHLDAKLHPRLFYSATTDIEITKRFIGLDPSYPGYIPPRQMHEDQVLPYIIQFTPRPKSGVDIARTLGNHDHKEVVLLHIPAEWMTSITVFQPTAAGTIETAILPGKALLSGP